MKKNQEFQISYSHLRYKVTTTIGSGGFSQVFKAKDIKYNRYVAIKKIDVTRKEFQEPSSKSIRIRMRQVLIKEAAIMKPLNHPNVIKLLDFYSGDDDIYLVLEYASGGELFNVVISEGHLTEYEAAFLVKQILKAVEYIHSRGIVHRDLKLENLLLDKPDIKSTLKLCDFGVSTYIKDKMMTSCGTLNYSAPELVTGTSSSRGYNELVDNWSIGVIAYILLCKYFPFYSEEGNSEDVRTQIMECRYAFHSPQWDSISPAGKEFVSSLLQLDPSTRLTLSSGLNNYWIKHFAESYHSS